MHTILFVDDNLQTLESYKKMFLNQHRMWKPFYADNAGEALEIFDTHPIDILITDLEMPVIDGTKLMREVQQLSPSTIRILFSGCTDSAHVLESAKLAHQIFPKPSCFNEINHLLNRSIYLQNLKISRNARQMLTQMGSLPSVPQIVQKIMITAEKPDFSLKEIAKLISSDLSMSINIIRLINTPYFGLDHKITSIEQAVSLLGLDILKPLIITIHFFDTFHNFEQEFIDDLLKHSTTTGRFCQAIFRSEKRTTAECDRAFIAGFMHDLGRIVLMSVAPELYKRSIDLANSNHNGTEQSELQLLETTHAEISAFLLGLWGFDDELIEAVRYHHSPSQAKCENPIFLAALHCADLFDREINGTRAGFGYDMLDLDFLTDSQFITRDEIWLETCHHANIN